MNKELLDIITKLEILAAQYDAEGKRAGINGSVPSSIFWQQAYTVRECIKIIKESPGGRTCLTEREG
jgi:hypothetical protein